MIAKFPACSEIFSTVHHVGYCSIAPCFIFLIFSALFSSLSLIYDVEFDSNSSCLDRLKNFGMIS